MYPLSRAHAAFADTPAACADARDPCIEQADDPSAVANGDAPEVEEVQFECDGGASLTECTSTGGELETCVNNDLLDQISTALSSITCDDAASLEVDEVGVRASTFESPASCAVVDCGEDSPFDMNDDSE